MVEYERSGFVLNKTLVRAGIMMCVHKQNILFVVNTSGDELLPSKWTLIMHLILYDDY